MLFGFIRGQKCYLYFVHALDILNSLSAEVLQLFCACSCDFNVPVSVVFISVISSCNCWKDAN